MVCSAVASLPACMVLSRLVGYESWEHLAVTDVRTDDESDDMRVKNTYHISFTIHCTVLNRLKPTVRKYIAACSK